MSSKHNYKHKNNPHKYFQGSKVSRPQAPQPKGYESPKEWMQFLGYYAQSVADAALTVSSEGYNNDDVKPVGNASDTKNNRGQLTGAVDIDRYSSLENSINTLRDSNSKEHNSLRKEWREDIRDAKKDLDKQITQIKADADKGIESSDKKINTFLTSLAIIVAIVLTFLGFIFKFSDDNILKEVEDNKSEIRENKRVIDENRERIIRIEETDKKQIEEADTKQQFKKNPK